MKKIYTLLIFSSFLNYNSVAQKVGIGLNYSTYQSFGGELIFISKLNRFHFGASVEPSSTKGKYVSKQLSNYGRTISGYGTYSWFLDLGYSRVIFNKISLHGELTYGSDNDFVNYNDNRFNGGGYHMVTNRKSMFGAGTNIGYLISKNWEIYGGYNTLKKAQFGIRILF